jgi:ATP-dependent Clp protease adaptor protein ClpS
MAESTQTAEKVDAPPPAVKAVKPRVRPEKQDKPELPPPWRVVLHNDPINLFEKVIVILHRLTPLSLQEAFQRTNEAHTRGRSVVLSTHRERAELYVEQLTSAGLTITMEADT